MGEIAQEQYDKAVRKGRLKYFSRIATGQSGFLLSMEDQFPEMEVTFQEDLGLEQVPLAKIIGTWSHSRATMFTDHFLPLTVSDRSEFASKWIALYESHLEEGIRDPVKLYEYLNWYYVVEGNKRVSVLNFVDASSIEARVIRLLPRKEPMTPLKAVYFRFIDFKKKTGISEIWLQSERGYERLSKELAGISLPGDSPFEDPIEHFLKDIYRPFRRLFHALGGQKKLSMTTGDVFLRYVQIFQMPQSFSPGDGRKALLGLMDELMEEEKSAEADLETDEVDSEQSVVTPFFTPGYSSRKPLKAAFLYARSLQSSGWSYAHEQGRLEAQENLGERIDTYGITDVPENDKAYDSIKDVVSLGADVVFSTSPFFANATLKAAIEYPKVNFYNCSSGRSLKKVRTYFGQSYESSFLLGALAALVDRDCRIGYIATTSGLEKFSRINGFVQGVRQINPGGKIKLKWNKYWDFPAHSRELARELLEKEGCSLIFQHSLPKPGNETGEFGLYNFTSPKGNEQVNHFAHTVWNWGNFYTSVLRNRLSRSKGDFKSSEGGRHYQFWGGLRTNVVDLIINEGIVPRETVQLISLLRRAVISRDLHPFTGPMADSVGNMKISAGEIASLDEIRSMGWLCDGIEEIS